MEAVKLKRYTYKPLGQNQIRLVRFPDDQGDSEPVSLELRHDEIGSATIPEYVALSYCWGNDTKSYDIVIQDSPFRITKSLLTALGKLCAYDTSMAAGAWLWVDQICINQEDRMERSQQVLRMWEIYAAAKQVYAWLGVDEEEDAVIGNREVASGDANRIERLQTRYGEESLGCWVHRGTLAASLWNSGWNASNGFHVEDGLVKTVLKLVDKPYFSRTWIVPEILQARQLMFLYGSQNCPARELFDGMDILVQSGWKYDVHKIVKIKQMLQMQLKHDILGVITPAISERTAFITALESLHGTNCSDVRDRVFAALSSPILTIRTGMQILRPDYRLSRDQLAVVVISHYESLKGSQRPRRSLQEVAELSRVVSRSLDLGDGTNSTEAYEADVAVAVLSCTQPWSEGEPLLFRSETPISSSDGEAETTDLQPILGIPGHFLQFYLRLQGDDHVAARVHQGAANLQDKVLNIGAEAEASDRSSLQDDFHCLYEERLTNSQQVSPH